MDDLIIDAVKRGFFPWKPSPNDAVLFESWVRSGGVTPVSQQQLAQFSKVRRNNYVTHFYHNREKAAKIAPPELLEETDDPTLNAVVERQNTAELKLYVRDWFDANPEMKEHRETLMKIASERPYLQDMDDVAAHLYRDPQFVSNIKQDAGRHALENLAQKQSAVPPQASASNTAVYASDSVITPQNVYALVDGNDQEWFEKNHDKISKAMQGK